MTNIAKILILPGDGIGPEVTNEAVKILKYFSQNNSQNLEFEIEYGIIGGDAIDKVRNPFPPETLKQAKDSNAILLGAVGGPKWDNIEREIRPERGLLAIRKELDLFANLRPALVFDALIDSSTLKAEVISNLDMLIIRELTGGIYFGEPKGVEEGDNGKWKAYNTLVYTNSEVNRIARVAFELATKRNGKVCSVDKANVLVSTEMWRQEVTKLHEAEYSNIELSHMYVDNASMQIVRNPKQFDVMLTTNMFGDILSDTASMLTGSLGMLPSASIGAKQSNGKQYALYEPVHGSAPDIAGQNVANPLATILSLAMMFKYSFNMEKEASQIHAATENLLKQNIRTRDIANEHSRIIGCSEIGELLLKELSN